MNLASLTDAELKEFINKMFYVYDKNNSGTLEAPEIALFFRDLYRTLGYDVVMTLPMAQQVIKEISQTGRTSLTPIEVYAAFKVMSLNAKAYF